MDWVPVVAAIWLLLTLGTALLLAGVVRIADRRTHRLDSDHGDDDAESA